MRRTPPRSSTRAAATFSLLTLLPFAACDGSDPTAPADTAVVSGEVVAVSAAGTVLDRSGVRVSVDGSSSSDVTGADGLFVVIAPVGDDGVLRLRFERAGLDVGLELRGVTPGATIEVRVALGDDAVTVTDDGVGDVRGFEGRAGLVSVSGEAGSRTLSVDVVDEGRTVRVQVVEGLTVFDDNDDADRLRSVAEILAALENGEPVKLEGYGIRADDGSIVASRVEAKLRDDDDDDDDDEGTEFEGRARLVEVTGDPADRVITVDLRHDGRTTRVHVLEDGTTFDDDDDDDALRTFSELLAALIDERAIELEGHGTRQDDGSIVATRIEAELEDDDNG